ncbi:MAG: alpha/beta fold hydrolase [Bacteroidota bacterium]
MKRTVVKGAQITYSRSGKGTPLVLIHGYPLDSSTWDKVVPLLEDSFDVIVPDLRGFGGSSSDTENYGMAEFAADLARLLDELGIDEAVLAGHSMGGYVALAFARDYPARVRGLGLVSTQAAADTPERKEGRYQSAEEVMKNGVGSVAESMPPKFSVDPGMQSFVHDVIGRQAPAGVAAALRAMAERPDSTELLKTFEMPVVIVHGEADALIPIDRGREVQDIVMQARMFPLKDVGHLPMMEAPEETANALKHLA